MSIEDKETTVVDLKTNIQQELWDTIEKNYINESYSSAILDALHLLTETIRNKTGLEGDGAVLIGQAFGSSSPMIQLNLMQTESEKNIQKGMVDLLRGIYTTIRNPRSHDKYIDSKIDADSIIIFLNYLLNIIDNSKLKFDITIFLNRIFDTHYVRTEEYSDLLADEIPKRQRLEIAVQIILKRNNGNIYNLRSFMFSLFEKLEESEIKHLYSIISEEIKFTSDHNDISTILHICPEKFWGNVNKVVKIRIENILFESVRSGYYDFEEKNCMYGALGAWVNAEHIINFEDFQKWIIMIVSKLQSDKVEEVKYVEEYFWGKICEINKENIHYSLKYYFGQGLNNKNEEVIKKLSDKIRYVQDHPWWLVFKDDLKKFPEIKYEDLDTLF